MGTGTVFILDPRDDENFCHEAWFPPEIIKLGTQARVALVFRWLSKAHDFFVDAEPPCRHALAPTPEIIEATAKRDAEAARAAARKRVRGF